MTDVPPVAIIIRASRGTCAVAPERVHQGRIHFTSYVIPNRQMHHPVCVERVCATPDVIAEAAAGYA